MVPSLQHYALFAWASMLGVPSVLAKTAAKELIPHLAVALEERCRERDPSTGRKRPFSYSPLLGTVLRALGWLAAKSDEDCAAVWAASE